MEAGIVRYTVILESTTACNLLVQCLNRCCESVFSQDKLSESNIGCTVSIELLPVLKRTMLLFVAHKDGALATVARCG